jgi:hypothetical protein
VIEPRRPTGWSSAAPAIKGCANVRWDSIGNLRNNWHVIVERYICTVAACIDKIRLRGRSKSDDLKPLINIYWARRRSGHVCKSWGTKQQAQELQQGMHGIEVFFALTCQSTNSVTVSDVYSAECQ